MLKWFEKKYPLPAGIPEFEAWAERILSKCGKFADEDSLKFALSTMVLHANNDKASFPDSYFVDRLRKAASNQVVSQVIQDIKQKQAEQLAKQQAEATAAKDAANGETQN